MGRNHEKMSKSHDTVPLKATGLFAMNAKMVYKFVYFFLPDLTYFLPDLTNFLPDLTYFFPDLTNFLPDLTYFFPDFTSFCCNLPSFAFFNVLTAFGFSYTVLKFALL